MIAKAVKKGYVKYSSDENDKRKRFLQFTEVGRKVLNAFEPIAFNQTKEALLTLTEDEITTVYRGIELYAKGLKNSRLRSKITIAKMTPQDNVAVAHLLTEMLEKQRLSGGIEHNKEWTNLFETYQKKGSFYCAMKLDSKIIGGAGISPLLSNESHVCELKRICIHSEMHNFGIEKMLLDYCLKEAKKLGYHQCYIDKTKETLLPIEFFHKQGFHLINLKFG